MKTSMYFNYTSRSLLRGGQRTILAVFCVAVGVMAIVALQLVGNMLQSSLTSNTRDTNGGDIAVTAQAVPFNSTDLAYFSQLKSDGTITNYSAITSANGSLTAASSRLNAFTVEAVDPSNFPVVTPPSFVTPSSGAVASLLGRDQVVVTQNFIDATGKKMGDTFNVYIKSQVGSGETLRVTIAGVVANTGVFAQSNSVVLISASDYAAAAPTTPTTPTAPATAATSYSTIYVTTADQAHTDAAVKAINQHVPTASTQTVADALKSQQSSIDSISKFLEIAGLLALLIGGVGIVNTMQVLLSRRKTEIAMLKTTGYRRIDLYLLFGLEAGLLGLVGGIIGAAAATGVSAIVRTLVQNTGLSIPFLLNPWTIVGGVAIGLATALIFGLLPIAQAANIRPLNVIRDLGENKGARSMALTVVLLVVLSIMFCALAIVILNNDVLLGIGAVYGTFAFLLLLSVFFGLVILIVSKLPVPERLNIKQLGLVLAGVVASILVYLALPVFGLLMLAVSLLGIVVVLLPRTWKASTKMALRNIGRQRARTTATMLALFIGVFTVGLVLALGLDLQTQISNAFTQNLTYNVIAETSGADTSTLQAKLGSVPGLSKTRTDVFTEVAPVAIDGQPLQQALANNQDRQQVISFLSTMEGYNLAQSAPSVTVSQGRNLNASDASANTIIISDLLSASGPFGMHLKVGDTVTFASVDGKATQTATIVGVYPRSAMGSHVGNILASSQEVQTLSPAKTGASAITYMQIGSAQVNSALNSLGQIVPNATVQNLAEIGTFVGQMLNNILEMLIALASLSVIAGVIIVANAVALAMLERRRELGILKSVGYTSSTVLSEVLIENGIVAGMGALMAALLAAAAVALLGSLIFNLTFSMSALVVISLVGGSALLAMLTAALVAWGAVRVRPLEVLRYE